MVYTRKLDLDSWKL